MPISLRNTPSVRCADLPGAPEEYGCFAEVDETDGTSSVCGIVLAGSYHWGDSSFERVLRGPLLPVAQTPVICYPLEWLRDGGVRSSVVCANSSTAPVRTLLGDGSHLGMSLDYFEDHEPRGPAGCAHDAARRSAANTFVVVEGSLIPSIDLQQLLRAHRESRAVATVVVEVERRQRGGTGDRQGALGVPGGIYVFDRRVLEQVGERGYQDIKQGLLERLHAAGEYVAIYEVAGLAPRVLDLSTYTSVNRWLITRAVERTDLLPEYRRIGDGKHHPTAQVHPSVRVIGPLLLGAHSCIEEGAVIVGPASIGAGSVIRAGALVSRSIIWDHCLVGAHAIVDASLLADYSVVGNGERVSGTVELQQERVSTHQSEPQTSGPVISRPPSPPRAERGRTAPVQLPPAFALPFRLADGSRHTTGEQPIVP